MAAGLAWLAAWAGRRTASGSRGDREVALPSPPAYEAAEESIAPVFQKTGPDVCFRQSLRLSSCLFAPCRWFLSTSYEAILGSESIRCAQVSGTVGPRVARILRVSRC